MNVKMIVSDLDGTLLRSDKTVSEHTINVLNACKALGHQVVFATARPPRDAYKFLPDVFKDEVVSCYNGALVLNGYEVLYHKGISKASVLAIVELAEVHRLGNIYVEIEDMLFTNSTCKSHLEWACETVDFKTLEFEEALKVIIHLEAAIDASFLLKLPSECHAILTDQNSLCQIMHKDVSKFNSIKYASEFLDLEDKEIIAFGDDYNDVEILRNSDIGVAMENATDAVKSVANFITLSNDDEGVASFLKGYVLS